MKIYNITKGQLITIWVIGGIVSFYELFMFIDSYDGGIHALFCFLIPLILIFYTLGWKNYRRSSSKE